MLLEHDAAFIQQGLIQWYRTRTASIRKVLLGVPNEEAVINLTTMPIGATAQRLRSGRTYSEMYAVIVYHKRQFRTNRSQAAHRAPQPPDKSLRRRVAAGGRAGAPRKRPGPYSATVLLRFSLFSGFLI